MVARFYMIHCVARWGGCLATAGLGLLCMLACSEPRPTVSPISPPEVDGSASAGLVYVRVRADGLTDLSRARLSDGAVRAHTDTPDRVEWWPYWSQAAGKLVFQARPREGPPAFDLLLWSPDGVGEMPIVTTPNRDERWPGWSPDGTRLVYAFRGAGTPASGVAWVEDAGATNRATLLARAAPQRYFFRPNFSPDGTRLVAQRQNENDDRSTLWLLSADTPPRPLTTNEGQHDSKAWYTRSGDRIVFSREPTPKSPRDVWIMDADGANAQVLVGGEADEHSARPSPTRDEFAFISTRDGTADVFLADLDGGNVRNLSASDDREEYAPRWSPDGERLVVTYGPRSETGERSGSQLRFETSRIRVFDRGGRTLFDGDGLMPDWMPPWPEAS